jgi:hypothetical protein
MLAVSQIHTIWNTLRIPTPWWATFAAVLLLPFLIVSGTYWLALQIPGTIPTAYWENVGAVLFFLTIPALAFVMFRAKIRWWVGVLLGIPSLYVLLIGILTLQSRWNCGEPTSEYIGPASTVVASVGTSCT